MQNSISIVASRIVASNVAPVFIEISGGNREDAGHATLGAQCAGNLSGRIYDGRGRLCRELPDLVLSPRVEGEPFRAKYAIDGEVIACLNPSEYRIVIDLIEDGTLSGTAEATLVIVARVSGHSARLSCHPCSPADAVAWARHVHHTGNREQAERLLFSTLREVIDDAEAWLLMGEVLAKRGALEEARDSVEVAVSLAGSAIGVRHLALWSELSRAAPVMQSFPTLTNATCPQR
jgi:hypothetical protein